MSGFGFDDDVTVDVDEALLARIRAEAARRAAGSGDGEEVPDGADEATQDIEEEVLESIRVGDNGDEVPTVEGYGALREIGRGGFSRVYEALQFEFQRWVAIKVLNQTLEGGEEIGEFERECRLMGGLSRHPNIVTVFASAFTSDTRPCIVMELFPHGSYLNILQRTGPLALEDLLSLTVRISGALATAHRQGMVHGDVKPQNIFRSEFGSAALGDFGIATLMHQRTEDAKTRLSLYYAAPELIDGGVSATSPFADQYSLAATVYTLATGLRPFESETADTTRRLLSRMLSEPAPRLGEEFPASLDEALSQAMAREPQDRHRDIVAFAAAIARVEHELGFKSTEIPLTRDGGRYVGQTPGSERPRSTTGSRSQDAPATPRTRTTDAAAAASLEQEPEAVSQTVLRPMVPVDTGAQTPEPEQPEEKPRIPMWAKIGSAVAAIAAAVVIVVVVTTDIGIGGGQGTEERPEDPGVGEAAPGGGDVGGEAAPGGGDVGGEAAPGGGDVGGEAAPGGGDVGGEAAPGGGDVGGEAAPGGGDVGGEAAPSDDLGGGSNSLIVFFDESDGDAELFVMDADGTNVRQLTDNDADDWGSGWVPAGEPIVFMSNRDGDTELFVMDADGTNVRQLTDNDADDWGSGWVPAGEPIVFTSNRDGDFELFVMDADGTNVRQLTDNDADDREFGWVPAGEPIVFMSNRDGDFELFVMDADGTNVRQLTDNDADDSGTRWSPDRTQVGFHSNRDGDFELFVMDADGTNERQLTHNDHLDWWLGWSPDGSRIAYSSSTDGDTLNSPIFVMDADGTNVHQLYGEPMNQVSEAPPSESYRIAFVSNIGGHDAIYSVDLESEEGILKLGEWSAVTESDSREGSPSWSPDGSWIAFQRRTDEDSHWQIFITNVITGDERQLLCGAENGWSPSWSSDGTRIAFAQGSGGENDIVSIDIRTGEQSELKDKSGETDRLPRWSPDGRHVAFVRGSWPLREIRILHVHSQAKNVDRVLWQDGDYTGPSWSPIGDQISYALKGDGASYRHIYTADWLVIDAGSDDPELIIENAEQLTEDRFDDDEPSWSHDGSWIAFSREVGDNQGIFVVNSAGGEPFALLSHGAFSYSAPSWAPQTGPSVKPTYDCRDR